MDGGTDEKGDAARRRPRGRVSRAGLAAHEAALLEDATRLFLADGFGATSIERLARAARVSPKTIYARYGGKAGLFTAVMRRYADRALAPFARLVLSDAAPAEVLRAFGQELLALVLSPDAVALQRAVAAEAARFPEFARAFYEGGPRRGLRMLAGYLRACAEAGRLRVDDPELAAESLASAIQGELVRRAVLNVAPPPGRGRAGAAHRGGGGRLPAGAPGGVGAAQRRKRAKACSVVSDTWCSMPSASDSAASSGTPTRRSRSTTRRWRARTRPASAWPASVRNTPR